MGADSLPRRALKTLLAPMLGERSYQMIQSVAMAWDIRTGASREPEVDLIRHAVRPGDTALDVGANYGFWAYPLGRAVAPGGKVYAFEPLPFTAGALRTIARLLRFRNVEIVEKGCAETAGRVTFSVPLQESGAVIAGLVHMDRRNDRRPGKETRADPARAHRVECEVIVLDEFLPRLAPAPRGRISFVKCDIEGAELFALRGARRTIADHRPVVVCEVDPWFLEGFGLGVADLVGFFDDLGYRVYRYERERLWPTPVEEITAGNWVFVHPDRHDRLGALLASPAPPSATGPHIPRSASRPR